MTVNSPREALEKIVEICNPVLAAPDSPDPTQFAYLKLRRGVLAVVREGLQAPYIAPLLPLTPVQQLADQLFKVALSHEAWLSGEFADARPPDARPEDYAADDMVAAELVSLRALLDPIRPPKQLDPAVEELINRAREEELIGDIAFGVLYKLARRLAK